MKRSMIGRAGTAVLATTVLLQLASCKDGSTDTPGGASLVQAKYERYCDGPKYAPALRHSFIVLDGKALAQTSTPEEFLAKNGYFRELILQLAGADRAIASGIAAPRERFTVLVLPADGGTAQSAFTGCVPGLNVTEQKELVAGTSKFLSGDPLDEVVEHGQEFTEALLGSVFKATKLGTAEPKASRGPFAQSPFVQGLMASRELFQVEPGIAKRIFLVSDLSRLEFGAAEAQSSPKAEGLAAGRSAADVFRLAEVYVVQPKGAAVNGKPFVEGFMTGQGGRLMSFTSGMPSVSSRAPVTLARYAGEIRYAEGAEPVEIVLGRDDRNKLAYSWFSLLGGNASNTPMTGTMLCREEDSCTIQSDNGGFAQVWKTSDAPGPQFDASMPLAGARNFKFSIVGGTVSGEIADPLVQLGNDPGKPGLTVKASKQ